MDFFFFFFWVLLLSSLMQQLTQEQEHDEGRNFLHQVSSPLASSPPGIPRLKIDSLYFPPIFW